jgi:hypothetical protein
MSPTCSPPGPDAVTMANCFRGSTFNPNGTLYRTTMSSDGTDSKDSIVMDTCTSEFDGGKSNSN